MPLFDHRGGRWPIVDGVGHRVAGRAADTVMNLGEPSNGSEIFRRKLEDVFKLRSCVFKPADFNQRAPERDVCREV